MLFFSYQWSPGAQVTPEYEGPFFDFTSDDVSLPRNQPVKRNLQDPAPTIGNKMMKVDNNESRPVLQVRMNPFHADRFSAIRILSINDGLMDYGDKKYTAIFRIKI